MTKFKRAVSLKLDQYLEHQWVRLLLPITDFERHYEEVQEYDQPNHDPSRFGRCDAQNFGYKITSYRVVETAKIASCPVKNAYAGSAGSERHASGCMHMHMQLERRLTRYVGQMH
jgi:hypothetical protein